MTEQISMKPYARLITMLGEQLVKDFNVALIEIIKNAYDAEAEDVNVYLENFEVDNKGLFSDPDTDEIKQKDNSSILICDNGNGMTEETIKEHWLNPATPSKRQLKIGDNNPKSKIKNRILQGEKGIGRFALFKIGKKITITTRPIDCDKEYIITYDFSKYDEDFRDENGNFLYLKDLNIKLESREPNLISSSNRLYKGNHGTEIKIEFLKGDNWNQRNINSLQKSIFKMRPIFDAGEFSENDKFEVSFFIDNTEIKKDAFKSYKNKLLTILEDKPVLKISGEFDNSKKIYLFTINGKKIELPLDSSDIMGLSVYQKEFKDTYEKSNKELASGSFRFELYFFDLISDLDTYKLDADSKSLVKENRIYLYRDNVRVAPYGDSTDDWLELDIFRSTGRVGDMPSNDQIVGRIDISSENNKDLRDATNREGLLENKSKKELSLLIKMFLYYIHTTYYSKHKIQKKQRKEINLASKIDVESKFSEVKELVAKNDPRAFNAVEELETNFKEEKRVFEKRLDVAEDLAGVGLSVESASHDMNMMMNKATNLLDSLITSSNSEPDKKISNFSSDLTTLRGELSFIFDRLKNIQGMFVSSKQRAKPIRVKDIVEKIIRIFDSLVKKNNIQITVEEIGSPLVVKTTDAILMQVLINLFDNSIYWLDSIEKENKVIKVKLDSIENKMIIADSGPGIREDDLPYIFEEFYTGKGLDGRGMGLYIARRLLGRNDFSIYVETNNKIEKGANFVIDFNKNTEN
ncbi:MAG: ATP-binding protein [Alphaproteobacteria bacterium]|jgi:signal transduction histidine kinase|nr:ATP-binding protein [Alphaproteobacteria bacterium]